MTLSNRQQIFLNFFPVPEFLLLSTTGIVLTDNDTTFVQLRRKLWGNGFELAHATKIDNPKGALVSGFINNPNELKPILEKLVSHYGIHYARATFSDEKAYLFTTTINWVPREGLKDAVAFIIEENAPISLAEAVFDFEIIRENKDAGEIKLAVTVLPKNIVSAYTDLLKSAGVTPVSFELESQAIAKAIIEYGNKNSVLIINLTSYKVGFYVVEDGIVQLSTTFSYNANNNLLIVLNDLMTEMRKVITFWNARTDKSDKPGNKLEKVILCGAGASDEEFVKKLMHESNIEYSLADAWRNISVAKNHNPEIPFNESLGYASAVGLVISYD